jgi:hypothetical protein
VRRLSIGSTREGVFPSADEGPRSPLPQEAAARKAEEDLYRMLVDESSGKGKKKAGKVRGVSHK